MSTAVWQCIRCGGPILGPSMRTLDGHTVCAVCPTGLRNSALPDASVQLTEADVRRIVREEIERAQIGKGMKEAG
jgi:uncharacterized Zn finger protein (UPF0148 family)